MASLLLSFYRGVFRILFSNRIFNRKVIKIKNLPFISILVRKKERKRERKRREERKKGREKEQKKERERKEGKSEQNSLSAL